MLARLDEDLAPLRASVDREGTVLRLEGPGRADVAARVASTVDRMGYIAAPIESAPHVSRWFGTAEVDELSQEEARVLAERWAAELAAAGVVGEPHRVIEPLRAALLEAFHSATRTGSVDAVWIDAASLRGVLDEGEAERVRRWIESKIGEHTRE